MSDFLKQKISNEIHGVWAGLSAKVVDNPNLNDHKPPFSLLNQTAVNSSYEYKSPKIINKAVLLIIPVAIGLCSLGIALLSKIQPNP